MIIVSLILKYRRKAITDSYYSLHKTFFCRKPSLEVGGQVVEGAGELCGGDAGDLYDARHVATLPALLVIQFYLEYR